MTAAPPTAPEEEEAGRAAEASPFARVPELDGLRGLAILLVVIWHLFVVVVAWPPGSSFFIAAYFLRWTWSGVDLFFVLSGFLIGGILLDARESKHYFKTFYLRRIFRIVPLYAVAVISYAVLSSFASTSPYLHATGLFRDEWPLAPYLLFLQNVWSGIVGQWGPTWLSVTWSLAVEEQFYLLLPFVVRFLKRPALTFLLVALIVLAPVVRVALFDLRNGAFWSYMELPSRLDALGLGALVAVLSRSPAAWAFVSKHWRLFYVTCGLFTLRILWHTLRGEAGPGSRAMSYSGYTSFAVLYVSLLLIVLIRKQSFLARLARLRTLRYLGGVSYFVYLFHQSVSSGLRALLANAETTSAAHLWISVLAFAVLLALAQLSWTWFEKPLIDRGHRYRY
jgi:peptidoglycan/LPS O-acetylase OafA/YrhL